MLNRSHRNIVLELDWLQKFNPDINWKKTDIEVKKKEPHSANSLKTIYKNEDKSNDELYNAEHFHLSNGLH